jgi:hypothetical protein
LTTHITKTWIEDGTLITQVFEEKDIYKREWVGLTDEEIRERWFAAEPTSDGRPASYNYAKAIEAKLKQKNGFAEEKNND